MPVGVYVRVRKFMRRRRPAWERIQGKYTINPVNNCWEMKIVNSANGYGYIMLDTDSAGYRPRSTAHRWSYEYHVGPIPDGWTVDHLCRNRRCINPAHLEAVTQRENNRRGNGVSGLNARKTHCDKGHPFTPENTKTIRTRFGSGRDCRTCERARARAYRNRQRAIHDELNRGGDA